MSEIDSKKNENNFSKNESNVKDVNDGEGTYKISNPAHANTKNGVCIIILPPKKAITPNKQCSITLQGDKPIEASTSKIYQQPTELPTQPTNYESSKSKTWSRKPNLQEEKSQHLTFHYYQPEQLKLQQKYQYRQSQQSFIKQPSPQLLSKQLYPTQNEIQSARQSIVFHHYKPVILQRKSLQHQQPTSQTQATSTILQKQKQLEDFITKQRNLLLKQQKTIPSRQDQQN